MKRFLILAAASAALILSGCAKNEPAPSASEAAGGKGEINFTTYTGRTVTKTGTDLNQSFNVEAFLTSTKAKYFDATDYTYASGKYTGAVTHYWPLEGSLDFYAVSPLKYKNTSGTDVTLKVADDSTFTVTATDGKTDIVAAKKTSQAKVDAVALEFGHKLTKVAFKAVGADTTKIYKIDSITVNANSTGKYNYGASESWTSAGTPYNYIFLGTDKTIPAKTKSAVPVGDTLFLIPSQGSVTAKVRYSVYEGATKIDTTVSAIEVDLPTTAWGINKSIAYVLTLNFTSSATPITFSATETGWDAEKDTTIIIPPKKEEPVFSVAADKKVKFTKGNLYWNGSALKMEENQYDCPTSWDASHVGHFFWSNTASVAYAGTYSDPSRAADDYFFCGEGHELTVDGQSGLYALSSAEWSYLLSSTTSGGRGDGDSKFKYGVTVNGEGNCLIIAPDGYSGTIASTYDATAWATAESAGLVCLPAAGYRDDSDVYDVGDLGYCWSSTPIGKDSAYFLDFDVSDVDPALSSHRRYGFSVRLVYSAQ